MSALPVRPACPPGCPGPQAARASEPRSWCSIPRMSTAIAPRLASAFSRERQRFLSGHPRSRELFERAGQPARRRADELDGEVGPATSRSSYGKGRTARVTDVDGHEYLDFCLGDTGAMTGHAPDAAVEAIVNQVRRGITFMLPTEDAIPVGEELTRASGCLAGRSP